ncbi:MAG: helix-turn-helix domain-containing protein, partial [Herbaspirillum sp.]
GIKCILGVPLLSGDVVLGVLFVGDRYVRSYSAWEMSILSTLAAHASVAIENARLFEQTQTALKQVNDANALLKRQSENTQIAAEAHEQLTALVAKGGGLKDICETVASMLHGHVLAIDEGEQIICDSSVGSGRSKHRSPTVPDLDKFVHDDAIHVALMKSRVAGRSVHALTGGQELCRVSAVIGNRGLLGGLIIVTDKELIGLETRIFERSALVAGIVFLTQERKGEAGRREIPAIFRGLLGQPQRDLVRLTEQAGRYGLDLTQPLCIAIVEIKQMESGYLLDKIRQSSRLTNTLVDEVDDALIFISSLSTDELRKSLEQLFKRELQAQITGVISRAVTKPSALPTRHQSLMRCFGVLASIGRCGSIFLEEELALYGVLFDQSRSADVQPFLSLTLGKLNQVGKQRAAELSSTLLCYLDHAYNARAAATELGIHINTLHQRLDAIEALIGDWRERNRALEIHVALRLMQMGNSSGDTV